MIDWLKGKVFRGGKFFTGLYPLEGYLMLPAPCYHANSMKTSLRIKNYLFGPLYILKGLLIFIPKFYMIIVPMSTLMKSI